MAPSAPLVDAGEGILLAFPRRAWYYLMMKKYLTLAVLGLALAGFATTSFAGSGCGTDHGDKEKKDGDKTEETTQS